MAVGTTNCDTVASLGSSSSSRNSSVSSSRSSTNTIGSSRNSTAKIIAAALKASEGSYTAEVTTTHKNISILMSPETARRRRRERLYSQSIDSFCERGLRNTPIRSSCDESKLSATQQEDSFSTVTTCSITSEDGVGRPQEKSVEKQKGNSKQQQPQRDVFWSGQLQQGHFPSILYNPATDVPGIIYSHNGSSVVSESDQFSAGGPIVLDELVKKTHYKQCDVFWPGSQQQDSTTPGNDGSKKNRQVTTAPLVEAEKNVRVPAIQDDGNHSTRSAKRRESVSSSSSPSCRLPSTSLSSNQSERTRVTFSEKEDSIILIPSNHGDCTARIHNGHNTNRCPPTSILKNKTKASPVVASSTPTPSMTNLKGTKDSAPRRPRRTISNVIQSR